MAPLLELLLEDELELLDEFELLELELLLELEELDDVACLPSPCPPQAASNSATVTMVNFFMENPDICCVRFRRFVIFPAIPIKPGPINCQMTINLRRVHCYHWTQMLARSDGLPWFHRRLRKRWCKLTNWHCRSIYKTILTLALRFFATERTRGWRAYVSRTIGLCKFQPSVRAYAKTVHMAHGNVTIARFKRGVGSPTHSQRIYRIKRLLQRQNEARGLLNTDYFDCAQRS